jgi:hypothetical protein
LFPGFAIDRALEAVKSVGLLREGSVRRVAVVGPGLDFTDKDDGSDAYPLQTIQPFATIDSLLRLGLGSPAEIAMTTFDLSARVNHHIQAAGERARAGGTYVLTLPRSLDDAWSGDLVDYWQRFGRTIGDEVQPPALPDNAGNLRLRAVRVRPDVVASISAEDLDIVLQRRQPAQQEEYDLVIATNVLVYYDVFEQSLAAANLAGLLRRGGLLLTNTAIHELPSIPLSGVGGTDVGYTEAGDGDRILWFERQ